MMKSTMRLCIDLPFVGCAASAARVACFRRRAWVLRPAGIGHHVGMAADEHTEPVLAQAMAARLMGGISVMGGTLVLTATRVVFLPLIGREGLDLSNKAAKLGQRLHR